jgi:hypothetical protein
MRTTNFFIRERDGTNVARIQEIKKSGVAGVRDAG